MTKIKLCKKCYESFKLHEEAWVKTFGTDLLVEKVDKVGDCINYSIESKISILKGLANGNNIK